VYRATELTFNDLSFTNLARCRRWHPGFPLDDWTGADWGNAAAGEMGEACNVVKKLRRLDVGHPGANDPGMLELVDQLGEEIADTVIYLDLLAQHYGIDLPAAIVAKFNAVSVREGFPERLGGEAGEAA
jgi:NTP pyrophosphatase (non-canonical NTP hydrolase)